MIRKALKCEKGEIANYLLILLVAAALAGAMTMLIKPALENLDTAQTNRVQSIAEEGY